MNGQSEQQITQENLYQYPYHYIPLWDGNTFSQTQTLAWGYEYLSYLYFVLDKVRQIGFDSLLDVGCGDGRFLFELSQRVPNKRLAGVDYSQRAIDYAQIMAAEAQWLCGDIRDERLLDGPFDVITLIETLEHIPPDEIGTFLKGVHHYLSVHGRLVVTVPSKNTKVHQKHYQHFDLPTLKETLTPFFTVAEVFYLNHNTSFSLRLMRRVLSNRFFILNHHRMLTWLYNYYVDHLLLTNSQHCRRLAVVCQRTS